ncbi:flagellar hook-basal body complex protein FliE, partial [Bacillus cereus]|uniref:flagellar hook-basal body complex protein FliE n=1 Tax=Bacillus cereus TaxID=1396 RepID=UPI00211255D9|nr:flagellar hook-basal body complex protein FliE [Bacillus cereus]
MKIQPMLNTQPFGAIQSIGAPKTSETSVAPGKKFIDLLEDMNQTQNNAQTAVYDLLTKGVGEHRHQAKEKKIPPNRIKLGYLLFIYL